MTTPALEVDHTLIDICDALEPRSGSVTFSAGSHIFEQGEQGDHAYLIDRGYVEVSNTAEGTKSVLAVLGPGEVFGEMALLDGQERSATATALHDTTVILISRQQLHDTINEASPLARLLVIAAIRRLRATQIGKILGGGGGRPWTDREPRVDQRYETVRADAADQVKLRLELDNAISQRQFELAYQPIVNLADGCTEGFEALIRWPRPGRRPVSPMEFIPLAEDTGLIVPLGLWVLERGLQALTAIGRRPDTKQPDRHPVFMSVNVSPRQLNTEENVERLATMIERADVDPASMKLEITEQTLLGDPRMAMIGLARLKATGAKIAIDDFGTGYSSLNYLHRFPLDTLKIDRSFVKKISQDSGGQRVVAAIIGLARELGMDVVAEGIEEVEELRWLQSRGCQYGQGYFMAKPVSLGEALIYLSRSFEW